MKKENNKGNVIKFGNVYGDYDGMSYAGNVWDKEYYCPALRTMQGGGNQPMIVVGENKLEENERPRKDKDKNG